MASQSERTMAMSGDEYDAYQDMLVAVRTGDKKMCGILNIASQLQKAAYSLIQDRVACIVERRIGLDGKAEGKNAGSASYEHICWEFKQVDLKVRECNDIEQTGDGTESEPKKNFVKGRGMLGKTKVLGDDSSGFGEKVKKEKGGKGRTKGAGKKGGAAKGRPALPAAKKRPRLALEDSDLMDSEDAAFEDAISAPSEEEESSAKAPPKKRRVAGATGKSGGEKSSDEQAQLPGGKRQKSAEVAAKTARGKGGAKASVVPKVVPAPAKATPAPPKATPAPPKATPAPPKATPAPPKATTAPPKASPKASPKAASKAAAAPKVSAKAKAPAAKAKGAAKAPGAKKK